MSIKLLVLSLCIIVFVPANAYEVPTEIQKKNVLLEVFTGIHCGNCPDGDVYTDNLLTVQPEHIFAIDIHSGHYAVPNAGQPDYRIDEGEAIDLEMGANNYGYPGAAINRRHFPEETLLVLGRGVWMKKSKSIYAEDAPVNLHVSSVFDGTTRELRVTVEGYYTQQVEQNENFLNVALIQDNIYGYQSGATDRDNYNHRHALRAYLTPLWGDTLFVPKQGEYFSREYTYTVPQAIKDIPVKAEDLEIIAFVSAGKREVLNVTGKKPEYIHYNKPLAATLQSPKPAIAVRYGYNFFDVRLKNESDQTITSAAFKVTVNGNEQTVNWLGEINSFHTLPLRLTVEPYSILAGDNEYKIQLSALNGVTVNGNSLQGSFKAPTEATPQIQVQIKTDLYADENTFVIRDRDGKVVHTLGPYSPGVVATYNETVDLKPSEIYCFEITDSCGDGILSPQGLYKLYKDNHTMFAQNYEVKVFGDRLFFQTTLPPNTTALSPVEQPATKVTVNSNQKTLEVVFRAEPNGQAGINLYSIDGKCLWVRQFSTTEGISTATFPLAGLPSGIYLLTIRQKEKKEIIKLKI
ncbi:MAG: Omp28-related outer membrane protein [Dysgonamonadaceae bacterium]|jgi:hypothetical protein|nr:Omp28-related outer membrane protein [Dysgonamonadaceae bacterium]